MKTHFISSLIAGLSFVSVCTAEPVWSPGALAMRCGSSGWKLADFFNDEGNAIDLPPSTPEDEAGLLKIFEGQLPDLSGRIERRLPSFKRAPGSYELGTVAGITVPSHCEARLVTRIYNQNGEERVFFDERLFAFLPEPERRLVVLRTAYSVLLNEPFQSDAKLLFRSLAFGRPLAKDLPEWVQLQTRLGLSPQLHGVPVSYKDGELENYFYFEKEKSPRSLLDGIEFINLGRVGAVCPNGFDRYTRSREDFLRYCTTSANEFLDSPSTRNFSELFGLFKNVAFRGDFTVSHSKDASGAIESAYLGSWAPSYSSKKTLFDAEFRTPWSSQTQWSVLDISLTSDSSVGSSTFQPKSPTPLTGFGITLNPTDGLVNAEWDRKESTFTIRSNVDLTFEGRSIIAQSTKISQNSAEAWLSAETARGNFSSYFPSHFIRTECGFFKKISFKRPTGKPWDLRSARTYGDCSVEFPESVWLKSFSGKYGNDWSFSYNRDGKPTIEFPQQSAESNRLTKTPLPQWDGVFTFGSAPMHLPITSLIGNNCAEGTIPPINVFRLFGNEVKLLQGAPRWSSCEQGAVTFRVYIAGFVLNFPEQRIRTLSNPTLEIKIAKNPKENRIDFQLDLAKETTLKCPDGTKVKFAARYGEYVYLFYTEKDGLRVSPKTKKCEGHG